MYRQISLSKSLHSAHSVHFCVFKNLKGEKTSPYLPLPYYEKTLLSNVLRFPKKPCFLKGPQALSLFLVKATCR